MTIVGASVYYYYFRELVASFALLGGGFFLLSLVVMTASVAWYLSKQAAVWAMPASLNVITFSRRLITAYARS
jgi:hypothetical protein